MIYLVYSTNAENQLTNVEYLLTMVENVLTFVEYLLDFLVVYAAYCLKQQPENVVYYILAYLVYSVKFPVEDIHHSDVKSNADYFLG